MAQDIGNYLANYWLDYLRTSKTVYIEPSTTVPNLDGTNVTKPAQGDYVRGVLITAAWAAAANRILVNSAGIFFISGDGNAASNTGPFAYFAAYDASSGGNFLFRGVIAPALAWVAGQPVRVAAGDLKVDLT